jgi:hypothetical protein
VHVDAVSLVDEYHDLAKLFLDCQQAKGPTNFQPSAGQKQLGKNDEQLVIMLASSPCIAMIARIERATTTARRHDYGLAGQPG